MRVEQKRWRQTKGWEPKLSDGLGESAQLVMLFGSTSILKEQKRLDEIKKVYPQAHLFGCSTAGEIYGTQVTDDSLVLTAASFEHTQLEGAQVKITEVGNSFQAGERLAQSLDKKGLAHVLVLSDGLKINGSDLVKGLTKHLPEKVTVTGGLSGDGGRFEETLVLLDGPP